MLDTILGLPVHALVVHVVVVLVPLAAIGIIAMAVHPPWRERFGWAVLLIATAGLVAVPVATASGKNLKNRLNASGPVARMIAAHQHIAQLVLWPTLAMWVLGILLVWMHRRGQTGVAVTAVALLSVVASLTAAGTVVVAGHRGSKAVWACTISSSACR
ncbi:MAG: hypothetical protein QOJ60_1700 [Actinomycetota bacterium]|jgi:hypothetical protein|nr:hypothetical protein [Actinomycetota bacterium]